MIALVRVDNRLVHGQVLETWVPCLRASRIVVADDDAAASHLARAAMTLALPPEVELTVAPVSQVDYAGLAASCEAVLLLFRDVEAVMRAQGAGLTPALAPRVNLGNVHYASGRRPVTPSVFLSRDELAEVERLAGAGFDVEARAVPSEVPAGPGELRHRYDVACGTG
jgi:PTS system mannose-specific IIB component